MIYRYFLKTCLTVGIASSCFAESIVSLAETNVGKVLLHEADISQCLQALFESADKADAIRMPIVISPQIGNLRFSGTLGEATLGEMLTRVCRIYDCNLLVGKVALVFQNANEPSAEFFDAYIPISGTVIRLVDEEKLSVREWFERRGVEWNSSEVVEIQPRQRLLHLKCASQNRILVEAILQLYARGYVVTKAPSEK